MNHQNQNNDHIICTEEYQENKEKPDTQKNPDNELLYKLIHPDYILFDWEYFSHELEFE